MHYKGDWIAECIKDTESTSQEARKVRICLKAGDVHLPDETQSGCGFLIKQDKWRNTSWAWIKSAYNGLPHREVVILPKRLLGVEA